MRAARVVLPWAAVAALAAGAACERRAPVAHVDTTIDSARPAPARTTARQDWAAEVGVMLVVPSDSENAAVILYPDEPSPRLIASRPTTLITGAGDTARVRLASIDSQQCGDAPLARIVGPVPPDWSVGLVGRSGALLRMDSTQTLSSPDSVRVVAELARLASALQGARESRFSGLPFAVLTVNGFTADSTRILIGQLVRRLNQEASPLEERTLLIAERPLGAQDAVFRVAYSQRSEGSEDTAEQFEPLIALRGHASTFLLLARDRSSETDYELLERPSRGPWRVRWSHALAC